VAYVLDSGISFLYNLRIPNGAGGLILPRREPNLLLAMVSSAVLVTGAVASCHLISPHAMGSGIPEMKAILSGSESDSKVLSRRTLVAKVYELMFENHRLC